MKKLLLFLPVVGLGLVANAQQAYKDNKLERNMQDRPVVLQQNQPATPTNAPTHRSGDGSRLNSILDSRRIGSAGNLLTIIEGGCNQIDVNDSLNAVVFIHRADPNVLNGSNVAQYAFDYSTDRGATWSIDRGPITVNPAIDNVDVNGRFPQAAIYNPAGNTNPANAQLVYSGTWHDNVTWTGQMRGNGQLGNVGSFNVEFPTINGGKNVIGTGMVQSQPGVFWLVNQSSTQTFTGGNSITDGIIVHKGVWNSGTSKVDWTETVLPQAFQAQDNSGTTVSVVTSLNIAFDPTGQIGWIAALGDITAGDDSVYSPIFWKSEDAGATWSAPTQINLADLQGVTENLATLLYDGETPTSGIPTTAFDADLNVDVKGNPHLLASVGNGTEYSIQTAGYTMWDITYDTSSIQGCDWRAIYMSDVLALRGTMTADNPAQTMDNRPLTSRSADGSKIFFFWTDSDVDFLGSPDNDAPNLFGKAIDVVAGTTTPLYNFTEGDTLWGGPTNASNGEGGVFGGAKFPMVSNTAWQNGAVYNVPLVLTQVDYNNDPANSLGSSEQPAAFWYVSNINFPAAAFNSPLDQTPPSIELTGDTLVLVPVGTSYTELGATAFDCADGTIVPVITNAPDVNTDGVYNVTYTATDLAGNSASVTRKVIVGRIPEAKFVFSFPSVPYRAQFTDSSYYLPTAWTWNFGDNGGSVLQNPVRNYIANGTYNVCLVAKNAFGSSPQFCQDVVITGVGINEIEFSNQINVFPNPASDKISIKIESDVTEEMTVSLVNLVGQEVTTPAVYAAGTTNMTVNTANLTNGLYFVKIVTASTGAVKPISINHNK